MNEFNYAISYQIIYKVYKVIRNVIYRYTKFECQSVLLGEENENKIYSIDEYLIGHKNNRQIWVLGIINNENKQFRVDLCKEF